MRILHLKNLYVPALSIVTVIFLLLVLISISTYRNLNREKTIALEYLRREGAAIVRSMEAGARAAMMLPGWREDLVTSLIQETGKDEDIAYVYLIGPDGKILHHSDHIGVSEAAPWNPQIHDERQIASRIRKLPDGTKIYELAEFFSFSSALQSAAMFKPGGSGSHMPGMTTHPQHSDIVVLGLKMTAYEEARRADLLHALIMAGILVILGSGAIFFIFVIQNYYLVDRTLKQTRDYTRQVVASMANGLLSIDVQRKITSYNPLALELLDLDESRVRGMDFNRIIDAEDSGIDQTLNRCQSVLEREITYRKLSGNLIPLALSATPILKDDGQCQGAVIILRDLREIKLLEEKVRRSEKLAAIGKLASGVAHEIRNPLSSIRGFAQFLNHSLKDRPREQEYAATMVAEVDRINRVVSDLLTFSRPMEAEPALTDITGLVEHTLRLVQADARSRKVHLHMKVSDVSELPVDANQMTQALLNLLLNALHAVAAEGHIEIGAELDPSDSRLKLWVEDDGTGIAPDQLEKIFEPFFTTKEKGTGLGLAIVHKIVENHNGEIGVESPAPGKSRGCRFTIRIPTHLRP